MVSLLFEVQDLKVASPATVSRAGMVYFDVIDLGWQPAFDSWVANVYPSPEKGGEPNFPFKARMLHELSEKWFPRLLKARIPAEYKE